MDIDYIDEGTPSSVSPTSSPRSQFTSPKKLKRSAICNTELDLKDYVFSRSVVMGNDQPSSSSHSSWYSSRRSLPFSNKYSNISSEFFPLVMELETQMKLSLDTIWQQLVKDDQQRGVQICQSIMIWEWRALALVLDRVLLLIFVVVTVITTVLIFMQPIILK